MISYSQVDYTYLNVNTDPAPQEGLSSLTQGSSVKIGLPVETGEIVISKGGGKTPTGSVGNGLAANQPIGLIPLRPCPGDDCRDNGECFIFNVFGGSSKSEDNDFNTFMLEYPFTGTPPYFDQNLSKWEIRRSINGIMTSQEVVSTSSDTCTFRNYVKGNYIYFYVIVWWDRILAKYGEGVYDVFVTSIVDGSVAAQCSDKFNLLSICCDKQAPAPPAPDNCDYGVINGELITGAYIGWNTCLFGWSLYATDQGPLPLYIFDQDKLNCIFSDTKYNHYITFKASSCGNVVSGNSYTIEYSITLDPGTTFQIALGTASGILRTTSGTYTETITAIGTEIFVSFGTLAGVQGVKTFSVTQYSAVLEYIRIPSLASAAVESVTIQNFDFTQLGQTFEALNPMYTIPGWTDTNGSYLSYSAQALHFENYHPSYPGKLAIGSRVPLPVGYTGFLRANSTNPLLNAGDTYEVTIKLDACDPEIQVSIVLGGTSGPAHNTAGTFVDTIICGSDGTGLTIAAEMIATSYNWRPAFVNYVQIVKVGGSGGKEEPAPCNEIANCTMQIKVSNGNSIFKYPNGERFDYKGKWMVNDMGTISEVTNPIFQDCLRLPGIFGYGESGEEKIDIRYNSGLVKNIRQEIIRRYTMKTDMLPYDVLERLEVFGRFAEEMLVSDFNVINPDYSLKERSVKIEGDFKPDYDTSHSGRTRLVMLELGFVDRVRDIERRIC